jgi:hypothetical protein
LSEFELLFDALALLRAAGRVAEKDMRNLLLSLVCDSRLAGIDVMPVRCR